MKRYLLYSSIALAYLFLYPHAAIALKYTSIASGNFSGSATWLGGIVPPVNINASDTILIESGHNVILDQDIVLSQPAAMLDVRGTLRSSGSEHINFSSSGIFYVSGTLDIDSMAVANITNTNITGQCTIKKLRCQGFSISGNGSFTITERLHVSGNLSNTAGNTISIAPNAVIYMSGGEIIPSGTGIFTLPSSYDVIYTDSAHTKPTGPEINGQGLRHVMIDLASDTHELKLGSDLGIGNGMLSLLKGVLTLNNYNLLLGGNGDLSATGTGQIKSTSSSDIHVNVTGSLTGDLKFSGNGNTVRNLVVNCGGTVKSGSALKVTGKVEFQNGKLDVQGHKLSLIAGATVTGADANKYIITGTGGSLAADVGSGVSLIYHIGTASQYAPCVISSNNNTVYNGLSVGVNAGVKVFGTSGNDMAASQPMVNATWFVNHMNTSVDIDMELMWNSAMEVNNFDHNYAFISHLIGNYWDKDADKSATLNANGLYSIQRTGIKSLSPFAVFDRNTVDITHIDAESLVEVYPNPATDILHVKLVYAATADITGVSGQSVSKHVLEPGNNTINVNNLPPGTYVIRLSCKGMNYYSRFIKQ